ncbi:ABC-2 type transport system ATP-binding protein [Williamsia limnetica]|uniref:ABC-2 type transport system ATP-binding protein n=1 Tax=Williamsia limnetica TaxID=882452 RepID=A0A318RSG7_WILLI|nr:ABC-2 type transport system ATP-binding protein [Williamsia limnetica]
MSLSVAETNAIEVADLRMSYRGVDALKGIDLVVPAGTVMGLLGPNGAGKTTTVKIIATLLSPTSGSVHINGIDARTHAHQVRSLIGLSGQHAVVDDNLTGHENLVMIARLSGLGRTQATRRSRELLEQFNLATAGKRRVATYSGGMRRRIDLAGAIIIRPPVLLLDEPTASLDPISRTELWSEIKALVHDGTSVLLTTQYLEEADQLAHAVTVIVGGEVVARGTPADLKSTLRTAQVRLLLTRADDAQSASEVITRMDGVQSVDVDDLVITYSTNDAGRSLTRAIGALARAGIDVADSSASEPTLDDVFVSLAGSAPRG